jgi:hypothetical protein
MDQTTINQYNQSQQELNYIPLITPTKQKDHLPKNKQTANK